MAYEFPWEAFMQAQAQKNKNKMQMMDTFGQTISGLGQTAGNVLQQRGLKQKQDLQNKQIQDWLAKQQQPIQKTLNVQGQPNTPIASYNPSSNQVTPTMVPNPNAQLGELSGLPMDVLSKVIGPILKETSKSKVGITGNKTLWRNSQTGDVTDQKPADTTGWSEFQVKPGQALQTLTNVPHMKAQDEARKSWADAWQKRIKFNQIDMLAKSVTLTPQQRNILQQNNMRANRAIEIANQANTWQEFGAMVTDAGAVMQGGVPHVDQLHNMAYPSWKQDLARIQTYITSKPTENVPQEFKDRIIGMMQGIQEVDNKYLTKHAEFMEKMLLPTIEGGGALKSPVEDITKTITERIPYKGAKNQGPKPGAIENGYRFKGGDPGDQNNWEAIK